MAADVATASAASREELRRHAAILEAVRLAAERFLDRRSPWYEHLPEVLASLATATGTSRVYLFENYREDPDGEVWATQTFEWSAEGVESIADKPQLLAMPMVGIGFARWIEIFRRGEPLVALRRDLPPGEQVQLEDDGTLSIAVVPILVDGAWWGMLGFDECAYERIWSPEEIDGLRAAGSTIAAAIRAGRDDADRARVAELLERRVGALSAAAEALTVDRPLDATLSELCRIVVEAAEARAASVALLDRDSGERRLWGHHGLTDGYVAAMHAVWDAGDGNIGREVLDVQQPQWVPGARAQALAMPGYAPLHPHLEVMDFSGMLVLPLDTLGRSVGALSVVYPTDDEPDAAEQAFLRAVADQAAATIENARLYGAAQHAAALEERQRLARDLHDSVSQALFGIALGARTARTLAERDPAAVIEPLDYVLGLAEAGLAEMRALIFELRPEALASEGLVDALDRQARALAARHAIEVDASLGDEPDLDLAVKEALYRVAQEALHNVVKHAHATRVEVHLHLDGDRVRLRIGDDGVGFDPTAAFPGHLGLTSMRERIAGVGGEIELTSRPDAGTTLLVHVPIG